MENYAKTNNGRLMSLVLVALIISTGFMSAYAFFGSGRSISKQVTATDFTSIASGSRFSHSGNLNSYFDRFNVALHLEVLNPDGSMVSSATYPDDLITSQMITLLGNFWGGTNCPSMKNTGGSTITPCALGTSGCGSSSPFVGFYDEICYGSSTYVGTSGDGAFIGIGTGTTPPARSDYNLQTQVGSWVAVNTPTIGASSVVVAAGITLTSPANVTEAGLAEALGPNAGAGKFLFFHDTFSAISLSSDQTLQVQYTLNLPSGSNQNLLAFFASMFEQSSSSQKNIGTMVTSSGTSYATGTFNFWGSSVPSACSSSSGGGFCASGPSIEVGTSNTLPTSTDYELNAQVGSTTQRVTTTLDTTSYEDIFQNSITLTSSYTIEEAGFFLVTSGSGAFLLFHNLTGAVSIPANNAITTQFTVAF